MSSLQFSKNETHVGKEAFTSIISNDVDIIERASSNSNVIHNFENFSDHVKDMYNSVKGIYFYPVQKNILVLASVLLFN